MRKPCTDCEHYKKTQVVPDWGRKATSGQCMKYCCYWKECQIYKNWQIVQKAEKLQRALKNNSDLPGAT